MPLKEAVSELNLATLHIVPPMLKNFGLVNLLNLGGGAGVDGSNVIDLRARIDVASSLCPICIESFGRISLAT